MMMMLTMEAVLSELSDHEKRNEQGLPPGFRFHPTDEELLTFYLASKVFNNGTFTTHVKFAEVDLNRCEPWELPEVSKMGEREWYLFSMRDRKYPTGLRTNRATGAGYWKATGKDKEVYNASSGALLGMKKTLVFYTGRAPRGEKTKWVMHEYRLDPHFSIHSNPHNSMEEWVICRIFHKSVEKRSEVLQIQGNLDGSSKTCLPPFHTTPPSFFTQLQSHQFQNDLSNSHLFSFYPFAPTNAITNNNKEHLNLPKSTKIEDTFYQYQLLDDDTNMLSNTNNSSNFQSSLPPNMDGDGGLMLGFSGDENAEFRDMMMSASIPFNKQSLQQILDSPIAIDSWPLPQHV